MENNNKESFKLLGVSASDTDSGSEVPEFVAPPPRKKRVKRRLRGATSPRDRQTRPCNCKGRAVGLSLASVLLFCWLMTISWLAIVLHGELKRLDVNVRNVVAGSQGVQDTLQKCHSLSRELQQNQTALFHHLANLTLQLHNFSQQLLLVQGRLQDIEEGLKAAPELVTVPRDLKALTNSVASFGSQIRDLNSTVATLKNDNAQLHDTSKSLFETVSSINHTVVQLEVAAQHPSSPTKENGEEREEILRTIANISANVSAVNDTLNKKLQWLQEDQIKDYKSIGVLQDMNQNVSARLTTLEGDCVKTASLNVLNTTVIRLAEKVKNSENKYLGLDDKVADLQMQTKQLDSNTTQTSMELRELSQAVSRINQFLHHPPLKQAEVSSEPPQPTQGTDTQTAGP